jgi:transcriptional regulator with XRE-family HTH domain
MSSKKSLQQRKPSEIQVRLQKAFNGMSVSDIAKSLGEKPSSFWNWATGRNEFPHSVLAKIARLNVSTHWLLTGEGSPILASKLPTIEQMLDSKIRATVRGLFEDDSSVDGEAIRGIIRDIVKEELAASRKHRLFEIDLDDAGDKEVRKAG